MTAPTANLPIPYYQALNFLRDGGLWTMLKPRPKPPEGARAQRFTGPEGALDYLLFRPARPARRPGLVAMLHGCGQSATDFANATAMGQKAADLGFFTIFPQQPASGNPMRCWNWFDPAHQGDGGEPALLAALIRHVSTAQGLAGGDVFIAGLSAGGAMAATVAQAFPGLVLAAGVHSGLPPGAAQSAAQARGAMQSGAAPWRAPVPLIVFHGSNDQTVTPANAAALTAGFPDGTTYHGMTRGGLRWTMRKTRAGELWNVQGMGHDWSGGCAGESHADPAGPDASAEMLRFFREQRAAKV